jgi:hypothetical protein
MKTTKAVLSALMFAGAALSTQVVLAADISHAPQALVMLDNTADFGASFGAGNLGNTFADKFTFSSIGLNDVDTLVSSIARSSVVGLEITGFDLFTSTDTLVMAGSQLSLGSIDLWSLTATNLAAGDYYVRVSGLLVSDTSGSFGANINLAPVPEPETYGMMLAGLGVLGFLARRRKQDGDAA